MKKNKIDKIETMNRTWRPVGAWLITILFPIMGVFSLFAIWFSKDVSHMAAIMMVFGGAFAGTFGIRQWGKNANQEL